MGSTPIGYLCSSKIAKNAFFMLLYKRGHPHAPVFLSTAMASFGIVDLV